MITRTITQKDYVDAPKTEKQAKRLQVGEYLLVTGISPNQEGLFRHYLNDQLNGDPPGSKIMKQDFAIMDLGRVTDTKLHDIMIRRDRDSGDQ